MLIFVSFGEQMPFPGS